MRAIEVIGSRDGWVCNGCGEKTERWDQVTAPQPERWATVDHKDPDGPNTYDNLWLLCNRCNSSKGRQSIEDWENTLGFTSAALRSGFTTVPNALIEDSSISVGARMTLIALMSFAWRGDPFPGQERLASMLGCSDRMIRNHLAELQDAGLLTSRRRGLGRTNVYRITDRALTGGGSDRNSTSGLERNPVSDKEDEVEEDEVLESITPPNPPVRALPSWSVDRKRVSAKEGLFAEDVLAEWNEMTQQSLSARGWLSKIVMRHREHPMLTVGDHVAIIASSLGDPWWKGPPSPSVIYGNDSIFERAISMTQRPGGSRGAYDIAAGAVAAARGRRG